MNIQVLGSGSSGNAYIVSDGETRILIECGLPWAKMSKASGFTLSGVDLCLISHEHGDHAKAVRDVMKNGITVGCSPGTAGALGIENDVHCTQLTHGVWQKFLTWNVLPLHVEHDAAEPLAFILQSVTGETLLYATDTPYLEYNVSGLTHMMVEANYDYDLMDLGDGSLNGRIIRSHMSIDSLVKWIRTGSSRDTVREIWLLHLSDDRSDADDFKTRVQAETGAAVYVA